MPTEAERQAYADKHYGLKETDVEGETYKYAKTLGCWHAKFKSANNRGLPDRIFITPDGVVFFIEFKNPKVRKVRKLQGLVIDGMVQSKARVFVTNDLAVAKRIILDMVVFGDAKK